MWRTLYKAFAGSAAHLRLPQGCFFGGSSVVACTQIPRELHTKKLSSYMYQYDLLSEQAWQVAYMALRRCALPRAIVKHILYASENVDAEALRERICDLCPEPRYTTCEADCLRWTNNGFGCYARSSMSVCSKQCHVAIVVKQTRGSMGDPKKVAVAQGATLMSS